MHEKGLVYILKFISFITHVKKFLTTHSSSLGGKNKTCNVLFPWTGKQELLGRVPYDPPFFGYPETSGAD